MVKLAKLFACEGSNVYTYGLEEAEELKNIENITFCNQLNEAIENVEIVIGPTPFCSNGKDINAVYSKQNITCEQLIEESSNKTIIAGSIATKIYELVNDKDKIIDIMKREELAILNTIATAEGTIEIAISNTDKVIHGSEILILGFGRVAKILASKMKALEANITCSARKEKDFAWIKAYGYKSTNINELGRNLSNYDIIINTVPYQILKQNNLQYVKNDCLLIDLASSPGGIDRDFAKIKGLKLIWALALPGKVAPVTTAKIMKNTIYNILKEEKDKC